MKKRPKLTKTASDTTSKSRYEPVFNFFKTPKGIAFAFVSVAIIFNAVFLWPEAAVSTWSLNDDVLHLTAAREASLAIHQNMDPSDFWLSSIDLGLPIFHYYQHLPNVILATLDQVTSFFLPLPHLLDISRYLFLVLFPLSVFRAMRRFEFDYVAAGLSALISPLISTNGLYGLEYGSYLWRGFGLYTQLWAMFFLPLALAEIYRTIRNKGSWFWAVLLSAVVLLSNLMYGVILLISAAVYIVLVPEKGEVLSRFKRSAAIFILTGVTTCYFFIPFIADRAWLNRSIWEKSFKFDSFGAFEVLKNLFTGNLLDYGRLPILTMLFFLAALFVIREWKKENYRLVLVLTIFWLVLYFGRPTWGQLLDILPFSQDLHLHRFIGGFQVWAIMLTGAGLSLFWQWMEKNFIKNLSFKSYLLVGIAFLLLLTPVLYERAYYYEQNSQWKKENQNAFQSCASELTEIKETLNKLPPGRVYAGIYSDFGHTSDYTIGFVPLYAVFPQLGIDSFGYAYSGRDLLGDVRMDFDNRKPEQYNLFNIRYVLLHNTWTAPNYYSRIRQFENYTLYQVPTTGYFDLVDAPAVFYGDKYHFYYPNSKWLASSLPTLKQHPVIVLDNKPESAQGMPVYSFDEVDQKVLSNLARKQPACGEIAQENATINEYRARFVTNRECYLVLKTNYHPGWVVTLDGKNVQPVMLSPGFIGIKVGGGTHEAVFSYQLPFYRLPLFVCGVLILLVLFGLYLGKNKNLPERLKLKILRKKY